MQNLSSGKSVSIIIPFYNGSSILFEYIKLAAKIKTLAATVYNILFRPLPVY